MRSCMWVVTLTTQSSPKLLALRPGLLAVSVNWSSRVRKSSSKTLTAAPVVSQTVPPAKITHARMVADAKTQRPVCISAAVPEDSLAATASTTHPCTVTQRPADQTPLASIA
ncbi:uncharacterized [Lates japonicus]